MGLFSIIVPVYNTKPYLERCINSILNQNYDNFELILIDDGSTDGSSEICDEYAKYDKRISVVHKENGGVSSARNCGIEVAQGTYIWFVDSDDTITPDALQNLQKHTEEQLDLLVFNSRLQERYMISSLDSFMREHYFQYHLGFEPWNKLYKREIIERSNIRFDTQETVGEDLLFNISYYAAICEHDGFQKGVYFINQDYYEYIERDGSAMNTASKGRIIQQIRLFDKIEKMLSGKISEPNLTYLFLLHLLSGIGQSLQGGITATEFTNSVEYIKYQQHFKLTKDILGTFFKNEHSTLLGRVRIWIFLKLMQGQQYYLAGKVMGMK